MTSGLIVNPLSGKQSGRGLALARKLQNVPGVNVRILEQFSDLDMYIDEFAGLGIETLFISSGDGTIQQIQTRLAESGPFKEMPVLCLLPHGTTNMTAADLGIGARDLGEQSRIVADATFRNAKMVLRERPTVRIANPADGQVRHGMFAGTGAVWQATVFCQDAVHSTGLKGDWATLATLAVSAVKSFGGPKGKTQDAIVKPYSISVDANGQTRSDGEALMFLTTTLDKLILGSRPFWGADGSGVMRASIFPYPPPNPVRWLWTAMYGSERRRMPEGCISFRSDAIDVSTRCRFVLDGEFFDPPGDKPLRIETGPMFKYLCKA